MTSTAAQTQREWPQIAVAEIRLEGTANMDQVPAGWDKWNHPRPEAWTIDAKNQTIYFYDPELADVADPGDFLLVGYEVRDSPFMHYELPCGDFAKAGAPAGFQLEGRKFTAEIRNERLLSWTFASFNPPSLWVRHGQPRTFWWNTTVEETTWNRTRNDFGTAEVPYTFQITVTYHGKMMYRPSPATEKWMADHPGPKIPRAEQTGRHTCQQYPSY